MWQGPADVVELAYTADLKSAPDQWVAGSSPAVRTTCTGLKICLSSIHYDNFSSFRESPIRVAGGDCHRAVRPVPTNYAGHKGVRCSVGRINMTRCRAYHVSHTGYSLGFSFEITYPLRQRICLITFLWRYLVPQSRTKREHETIRTRS